jgi:hypothetical protein
VACVHGRSTSALEAVAALNGLRFEWVGDDKVQLVPITVLAP